MPCPFAIDSCVYAGAPAEAMRGRLTRLLQQRFVSKLTRYVFVGGFSALTEWCAFALFVYLAGINYVLAAVLSFLIATGVNYLLSLRFVFDERRYRQEMEIALVYAVSIIGAGINIGVMVVLVEMFSVHTMVAKVLGTGSAFLWNFLTRYLWIFRYQRCRVLVVSRDRAATNGCSRHPK